MISELIPIPTPITATRSGPQQPRIRKNLRQILSDLGHLSAGDLAKSLAIQARQDCTVSSILVANGMVTEPELFEALASLYSCALADFQRTPPDTRLIDDIGLETCLRLGCIPWKRVGSAIVLAVSDPEQFAETVAALPLAPNNIRMALSPKADIERALARVRRKQLTNRAEMRVQADESCRNWQTQKVSRAFGLFAVFAATSLYFAPSLTMGVIFGWAIFTLFLGTAFKLMAALAMAKSRKKNQPTFSSTRGTKMMVLPTVSIIIALYQEKEIAARLVKRLKRLNYPKELLDVHLVVEEDDYVTQAALKRTDLPAWMRQIVVPRAPLKTKPRALNYALDFCKGSIVGVYDAEDAPEPDQIHKVVRRFHDRGPKVACLQGILDFYNPTENWLSRCFTIEYATWFRVILPGLEKLGLAVPLGGTTLFFRKSVLEKLGGWDAHNVTEDADLGIRLARYGYKTELISTITKEEANCRFWPWIKQRSRWLKGYAMTWAVHMRSPRKLWQDLGPWRFFGFQVMFLGTLSQFLLAPLLWSFWFVLFGYPHPLNTMLSPTLLIALTALFMTAEVLSLAISTYALSDNQHRRLWPWVITMQLYLPLGALAACKALSELLYRPFYWDKTSHGLNQSNAKTALPLTSVDL